MQNNFIRFKEAINEIKQKNKLFKNKKVVAYICKYFVIKNENTKKKSKPRRLNP